MSKALLITGATGKQGGFVVKALAALPNSQDFTVLAVTRDTDSDSARKLASTYQNLRLVKGDMDDTKSLFQAAKDSLAGTGAKLWGVFSVQPFNPAKYNAAQEVAQGKAMIHEAEIAGVERFVYTSVDRGGEPRSNSNPTNVPHFASKHTIEQAVYSSNLRSWTILRPVGFMDNFAPGMQTSVFLSAWRQTIDEDKPLQLIAASDIGWFAAQAFAKPADYHNKAVGLAGDSVNFKELDTIWRKALGSSPPVAWGILGKAFVWGLKEMGLMIKWFASEGYRADIDALRKVNPDLKTLETWLKTESKFKSK